MSHQMNMNTKIRLVRCPKCQLILPELPKIPVYKCGGCNTVLQAKHQKPDMKEAGFDETDDNGPKEGDHVSGYIHLKKDISKGRRSSVQITTLISDEDSSPEKKKETKQDNYSSIISSQDIGRCGNGDGDSEWHRGKRVSGFSTSMELTSNEMEDSSLELQPYLVTGKGIYDTEEREHFEGSNLSDDVSIVITQSSPESCLNKRRGKSVHLSRQDRASSKVSCQEPEIQSEKSEAEKLLEAWTYKGLQAEESDSADDNQSPLADKVSPDARYVLPRKLVSQDSEYAISADSLSNLPIAKPRLGFSGSTWTLRPSRRKLKHPAFVTSDMPPKQSESSVLKSLRSDIEIHHQGYNRSHVYDIGSHESEVQSHVRKSAFLEANRNTMNYANYNQENGRYGHYSVCRRRQQNEGHVPRLHSPDTPLYSGPDKLELLKKINELKDEVKRTRISGFSSPTRFSSEQKHNPTIYHEVASVEGVCSDCFRCSCRTKCSHQLPQAAYMPRRGTSVCLPQGYHYSGGLPLHNRCCNHQTHYLDHTCQSFNKGFWSSSSSHQLHSGHQFLHDHEIKSDNRMYTETKGVRRVNERNSSSMRYMRPTAGGSPLISCYHCSELLQLPADFLLNGRRSHRLKCNACTAVMTFSIQGGKHLVPCIPDSVTPPPSMVDDCNGSFDRIAIASSSSSSSHPNKYANGEPYVRCKNSKDTRKGKQHRELLPTSRASTLHRLMGYSSPSHVRSN